MSDDDWPQRRTRHPVQYEVEVTRADGGKGRAVVTNLSLDGCEVAGWFRIGEAVALQIPRIGLVRGQVRWAMNGRAGIRFRLNSER